MVNNTVLGWDSVSHHCRNLLNATFYLIRGFTFTNDVLLNTFRLNLFYSLSSGIYFCIKFMYQKYCMDENTAMFIVNLIGVTAATRGGAFFPKSLCTQFVDLKTKMVLQPVLL